MMENPYENPIYTLLCELRQRTGNLIDLLNSNDIPKVARIDITRTCTYSIYSSIIQLIEHYEQKNRKN